MGVRLGLLAGCLSCALLLPACGWLADKDRIVIAKVDGQPIRRGDLKRLLRDMSDEERPLIQNKGDLLRTLNRHIDTRIRAAEVEELRGQDAIQVDRELARRIYFAKNPEYAKIFAIQDPSVLDLTEGDLVALRADVEFGIDEEEERLLREQAVAYRAQEALAAGALTIGEEEFQVEYAFRKGGLMNFEMIEFIAVSFPRSMFDATSRAADIRRRADAGESFREIAEGIAKEDPEFVLRTTFQNNPSKQKFRTFWNTAAGAEKGDILGPLFLPDYELVAIPSPGAPEQVVRRPAAYVVLQVLAHVPETPKTLEQAKPDLAPIILMGKMMERLRVQHGVEVYEDKLWNPAGFGDQFKDYLIRTE